MTNYEILKSIEQIQPGNLFLEYIVKRVQDDNYRGMQCSQHNRLTYDYFKQLMFAIYEIANNDTFDIHIGDDHGVRQLNATTYYQIVDEIKKHAGKGTINSVKKNTFPDLARAGLLERFNKNGEVIKEVQSEGSDKVLITRQSIHSVGLSKLGLKFVEARNEFERRKYYTDAVDVLTKNAASELVELLSTDGTFDSISILEFMYIFSDDRENIHYNDKIVMLYEYRKLSSYQQSQVTQLLQLYCDPARNIRGNKIDARDYSNWKNESQQIFGLLSSSTYFKVMGDNLLLNNGEYGLFVQNSKRSEKPKDMYFKYHGISKNRDYELHHIIPFKKAINQQDAQYIDDERNLIYLHKDKHAEFTSTQNVNIRTAYSQPILSFFKLDTIDDIIHVNIDHLEALLSKKRIDEILSYNKMLLKKFYHV